jgi:hypothetical protein
LAPERVDAYLVAASLNVCNRVDEATLLLLQARADGQRDQESTRLLLDLLLRSGDEASALEIARTDQILLSAEDWSALEAVLPPTLRKPAQIVRGPHRRPS